MDHRFKWKVKTIKLLEDNRQGNLYTLGMVFRYNTKGTV